MRLIADLAIEHDLIVITDEVYEHLVFDDARHIPLATLPGMRDRTLVISSGGKTFNTTGWKIGWICGSAASGRRGADRQAVPHLRQRRSVPAGHRRRPRAARLVLRRVRRRPAEPSATACCRVCTPPGSPCTRPSGTYFVTVDIRPVQPDGDGMAFCRALPERCGVVAIPNEVFYANRHEGRHLVRFAFCKRLEVLDEAAERLAKLATG